MAADPVDDFISELVEGDYAAIKLYEAFVAWWPIRWGIVPTIARVGRRAKTHPRVFSYRVAAGVRYLVRDIVTEAPRAAKAS